MTRTYLSSPFVLRTGGALAADVIERAGVALLVAIFGTSSWLGVAVALLVGTVIIILVAVATSLPRFA